MTKLLTVALAVAMIAAGAADAATKCKDPKTGKFIKCPPAATAPAKPAATTSAVATGKKPPHCTKGKLCGNTCIKATDVCHKP